MCWFVPPALLSLFGLCIRHHFCTYFTPPPIVLFLLSAFLFFCRVGIVYRAPIDLLIDSAIAIIIFEFVVCVLDPVGPSQHFSNNAESHQSIYVKYYIPYSCA